MNEYEFTALLDDTVAEPDIDAAWLAVQARIDHTDRRRTSTRLLLVAAVVVVTVAIFAGASKLVGDDDEPAVFVNPTPTTVSPLQTGSWTPSPVEPAVPPGREPVMAWTGKELFVFAGDNGNGVNQDLGALYNPKTRAWRALPDIGVPLVGERGARMGDDIVLFGTYGGAIWNIADESWRYVVPRPTDIGNTGLPTPTFAGDRVYFGAARYAYDVRAEVWVDLPAAPFTTTDISRGAHGDEYVVLAGGSTYVLDPATDTWRGPTTGPPGSAKIRSTGTTAIAIDESGQRAYRFDGQVWNDFGAVAVGDSCTPVVSESATYIAAAGCDGASVRRREGDAWVTIEGTNPVATTLGTTQLFAFGDQTTNAPGQPLEHRLWQLDLTPPAGG